MNKELFRIYHPEEGGAYLAKITAYLPDRSGSLAGLAEIFAKYSINITIFNYDRSTHPNRVILEVISMPLCALQADRHMWSPDMVIIIRYPTYSEAR